MDQIRFGLEICMNHNWARLKNSIPDTERPHVQLVSSGGAKINPPCVWVVDDAATASMSTP